jgi:ABC-type dipeptide/oligopeptide/nickel transport system permease subunit
LVVFYQPKKFISMNLFATGYLGSDLVANVATSVQTTLASMAPVIELVIGIVLAFVLAKYLIGLFKHVGKR